jgi:hypothetical protein
MRLLLLVTTLIVPLGHCLATKALPRRCADEPVYRGLRAPGRFLTGSPVGR